MDYWWCKGDTSGDYRDLNSFGPSWPPAAYYEEGKEIEEYPSGPFDPGQKELAWEKNARFPIQDFISPASVVFTCLPKTFILFQKLIEGSYITFPLFVEGEEYISFRPIIFLDLLDHEHSEYRVLESGTYSNFKKIILKQPPDTEIHFFGLEGQFGLRMKTIVSDKFKKIYDENNLTGLQFRKAFESV